MKQIFLTYLILVNWPSVSQTPHSLPELQIQSTPCISNQQREEIQKIISRYKQSRRAQFQHSSQHVLLDWPIRQGENFNDLGTVAISNYVDHDLNYPGKLQDYNCGTRSYDRASGYNHKGIDIFSWPFPWSKMNNDQVEIVAAADGIIIFKRSTETDTSCSFNSNGWNAVYIEHEDGSIAWYGHLKKNSLTNKPVGAFVSAGDYLGIMGSSGVSTLPHLHLEIYNATGDLIDPFYGACNSMNNDSWWSNQADYHATQLNTIHTHKKPPTFGCSKEEQANIEVNFLPGQKVYFSSFFRDQLAGVDTDYTIQMPDGSNYKNWTHKTFSTQSHTNWYWDFSMPINGNLGKWCFSATYNGQSMSKYFYLVDSEVINELEISPANLVFDVVDIGESATKSFDITNTGNSGVILNSITYPLGFSGGWNGTIDAKSTKTIQVTFRPDQVGLHEGQLIIQSTGLLKNNFVNLKGTGGQVLTIPPDVNSDIFPNPNQTGLLKTPEQTQEVKMFNLAGELLKHVITKKLKEIDISEFKAGIYLIDLVFDSHIQRLKLIIE